MSMPRYLPLAISCLPYCHVKPLTHLVLANRCLAMVLLCSAPLIALLVAGEVEDCSMLEHDYVGISQSLILINASIYLVKGGRLGLMPGVFSTLAALVSVIPVLCSLILHSLHGWVIMGTP